MLLTVFHLVELIVKLQPTHAFQHTFASDANILHESDHLLNIDNFIRHTPVHACLTLGRDRILAYPGMTLARVNTKIGKHIQTKHPTGLNKR